MIFFEEFLEGQSDYIGLSCSCCLVNVVGANEKCTLKVRIYGYNLSEFAGRFQSAAMDFPISVVLPLLF
jgi:hypothetical protein